VLKRLKKTDLPARTVVAALRARIDHDWLVEQADFLLKWFRRTSAPDLMALLNSLADRAPAALFAAVRAHVQAKRVMR
jgi:hypothetical protein